MGSIQNSFAKLAANDGHPVVHHVDSGMDTARKMFEKWAANEGHPLVRHADGSYAYPEVEHDWRVWRIAIMFHGTPN